MENKSKKIPWGGVHLKKEYITLLSVISAISVVILHANGCFWNFSKSRTWFTANIIESIFYFAVPIFFMITGANLIDYQEKYSTKKYFKKRLKKTVIPFLIWSLIGLLFEMFYEKSISLYDIDIKYIFNGVMNTKFIGIYWFFIPLFCIYLSIPLFASIDNKKKKDIFTYLAITGFILNCLIPFIIKVFSLDIVFPITITIVSGALLYVIIGYLLSHYDLTKNQRYMIYLLSILGLLMHIIGTYILSMDAGRIIDTYKGYYNVPCILNSVGIFIFIKELSKKVKKYKIINFIGKYTFSIYLMHWYILRVLTKLFHLSTVSILYRLGLPFVIIGICILITFILRKIPIIKKIVP